MNNKYKFTHQVDEALEKNVKDYLNNEVFKFPVDGCVYAFHDCLNKDGKITSELFAVFFNKEKNIAMYVPVEALKESLQMNDEKMSLIN